jgi:hypothetical protein
MQLYLTTWDLRLYFRYEERCVANFIALKNPSPRSGLNTRPSGPGASTLTSIPPRRDTSVSKNGFMSYVRKYLFCVLIGQGSKSPAQFSNWRPLVYTAKAGEDMSILEAFPSGQLHTTQSEILLIQGLNGTQ